MSSTNRGYERHATDYYRTPTKAIEDFLGAWFLDLVEKDEGENITAKPDKARWLDPCAGGDSEHAMSYPSVIKELFSTENIITIDIRPDSLAEFKTDYLTTTITPKPDIIITNPPFYLAEEIIKKALRDVSDDGYVIMLLRLNFFGSKKRSEFLRNNMPQRVYVHPRRMSFTENGKTDSIEYMHAIWKKNYKPEVTLLKIL